MQAWVGLNPSSRPPISRSGARGYIARIKVNSKSTESAATSSTPSLCIFTCTARRWLDHLINMPHSNTTTFNTPSSPSNPVSILKRTFPTPSADLPSSPLAGAGHYPVQHVSEQELVDAATALSSIDVRLWPICCMPRTMGSCMLIHHRHLRSNLPRHHLPNAFRTESIAALDPKLGVCVHRQPSYILDLEGEWILHTLGSKGNCIRNEKVMAAGW